MERATELHWLRFFYQNADIGLTEDDREVIERLFIKKENLLLPEAYEVDNDSIQIYYEENAMKVFVVLKEYKAFDQGCSWPSAVFSTHEKAKEFIKKQEEKFEPQDYFWEIDSFEVDAK